MRANSGTIEEECLDVVVVQLPHISNFDDFDPLVHEPQVHLRFVRRAEDWGNPDLIVIPGSKTTVADLDWLRTQRLDSLILGARQCGTPVIGICAGFQMLGEKLFDPYSVESARTKTTGMSLLPTSTKFLRSKSTHQVKGKVVEARGLLSGCEGADITAYEIHMGTTIGDIPPSAFIIETRSGTAVTLSDGVQDSAGLTLGTYLHGIFHNRAIRRSILETVASQKGMTLKACENDIDPSSEYDKLAELVRKHLDMDLVYRVAGLAT